MRSVWIIVGASLLAGCATHPVQPDTAQTVPVGPKASSAALAFDPPLTLNERPLDLSRSGRGEAAFAGFEDTTTTYFNIWTDDRRTTDFTNSYVREGYIEKVGSISR